MSHPNQTNQPNTIKRMVGRRTVEVPNPFPRPHAPLTETKPDPQPEKSQIVILTLLFIVVGVLIAFAGAAVSLPALATFGATITLAGATLAILSLRE